MFEGLLVPIFFKRLQFLDSQTIVTDKVLICEDQ